MPVLGEGGDRAPQSRSTVDVQLIGMERVAMNGSDELNC
jgi:hypothetical protein